MSRLVMEDAGMDALNGTRPRRAAGAAGIDVVPIRRELGARHLGAVLAELFAEDARAGASWVPIGDAKKRATQCSSNMDVNTKRNLGVMSVRPTLAHRRRASDGECAMWLSRHALVVARILLEVGELGREKL